MPFQKGNRLAGSRRGKPNRLTGQLKDMVLNALAGAGGQAYLEQQAKENPTAFLTLVGKVLPLQVSGEGGGPVIVKWQD